MEISLIINIVCTIVEIIGVSISIVELIRRKNGGADTLSISYIEYKADLSLNQRSNSYVPDNFIIIIVGSLILIISLAFHSLLSTVLSLAAAIFLIRNIYFIKKENIPFEHSRFLFMRSITFTALSISTYYFHPLLIDIADKFPDTTQIPSGASYLVDWLISTIKIIVEAFSNITDVQTSFPCVYILLRTAGMTYLIVYLIVNMKRKRLFRQLYNYELSSTKSIFGAFIQFFIILLLLHINLIYFSVIVPISRTISNWLNN